MKAYAFFGLFAPLLIACSVSAQTGNVGIGTSTPSSSAVLDLNSTSRGLLVPRMNTSQMTGIINAEEGLLVYNTSMHRFYGFIQFDTVSAQYQGGFANVHLTTGSPEVGQSFTTTMTGPVVGVTVTVQNNSYAGSRTMVLQVYNGAGYVGNSISIVQVTIPPTPGPVPVFFPVGFMALAGQVRSFRITCTNCGSVTGEGVTLFSNFANPSAYAGGAMLSGSSGTPSATTDLEFTVNSTTKGWKPLNY